MAPRKSSRVAQAEAAKAADTPPPVKKDAKATKGKPANKPGPKPKANTAAKRADPEERTKKLPKAKAAVGDKATGKMPIKAATGARRGRPKKDETAPVKAAPKRKLESEEVVAEREAKKAKQEALLAGPPRRARHVVINEPRYTKPLNVFVFGEGSSGELGLGSSRKAIDVKRPRFNEQLTKMGIVRVATGGMHCVALTSTNEIVTWGVNDNGALGRDTFFEDVKMKDVDENGDSDSESDDDSDSGLNPREATPTAIPSEAFPGGTVFVDVAAGDSCSFALTDDGYVFGWGCFRKNEGVLGFTKEVETARVPMWIPGLKKITKIVCGTNHVLALDKSDKVWAWGNGQQNQLGRRLTERTMRESLVPTHVGFTDPDVKKPSKRIIDIACGDYHGFALGDDGHVWSWGVNNYGETGIPEGAGTDNASITRPTIVQSLDDYEVDTVSGGSHHNVVVLKDGRCLAWGRCDGAALGIPLDKIDESDVLKDDNGKWKVLMRPTIVPGLENIFKVSCGPDHNIAINKNGKAFSWGFSATYQTGQGTDDDIPTPTLIDNTAVRERTLEWAGCGGQYSMLASYSTTS